MYPFIKKFVSDTVLYKFSRDNKERKEATPRRENTFKIAKDICLRFVPSLLSLYHAALLFPPWPLFAQTDLRINMNHSQHCYPVRVIYSTKRPWSESGYKKYNYVLWCNWSANNMPSLNRRMQDSSRRGSRHSSGGDGDPLGLSTSSTHSSALGLTARFRRSSSGGSTPNSTESGRIYIAGTFVELDPINRMHVNTKVKIMRWSRRWHILNRRIWYHMTYTITV